jgi:hypothetical protein
VQFARFFDGQIVNLNRIPLPADIPIIDLRFTQSTDESPEPSRRLTLKQLPESLAAARFDPGRERRIAKRGFLGSMSLQSDSLRSDRPKHRRASLRASVSLDRSNLDTTRPPRVVVGRDGGDE